MGSENSSSLIISPTFVCYENTLWSFSRNQKYRKSMKTVKLKSEFSLKIKKYVSRIGFLLQIQYKIIKFEESNFRVVWIVLYGPRGPCDGLWIFLSHTRNKSPQFPIPQGMQGKKIKDYKRVRDEDPYCSIHIHSVETVR